VAAPALPAPDRRYGAAVDPVPIQPRITRCRGGPRSSQPADERRPGV